MLKRTFDLLVASLGLLLLSPLLLLVAVAIKLGSPGPVLYRGLRTGRFGKPFHILKFRTMVIDAERLGGTTTGLNDPRVTRTGAFLRKYKLDELPQLINVWRGEMSFVGPRPEVLEYTDKFTTEEQRIFTVRPGITDLASIELIDLQSIVGSEDPDRVFREQVLPRKNLLRLEYVDRQSLLLDIRILAKTFFLVLAKPLRTQR
jgi:lipopolysaccharide/colanic/teichoic acid biosynthesis glycosyltransferase